MRFDVVCLGHLVADIIVRPVEKMPARGATELVDIEFHTGGCALNTAVVLGKIGLEVGIIGKAGSDFPGDFVISKLIESNVNTQSVKRSDINTATSIVMVSADGERSFFYDAGASGTLSMEDVDFDIISSSGILHIGGIMEMNSLPTAEILRKAKELGVMTSVDTDWDPSGGWFDTIAPSLECIDILTANIDEGRAISGEELPDRIASFFLSFGVEFVAVKMGEKGCYVATENSGISIPAYSVDVVDTTGTGDAFAAGFLAGILKGWDLRSAGKLGNALGAMCATSIGATTGVGSLADAEELMKVGKDS